ncbi:MAG: hypothetical protein J3Q66DRAFT_398769 [Benniella sp.]|nr:MAG: hypothetical protein J3Q66DRAFT_398769 [Benniella sp.]
MDMELFTPTSGNHARRPLNGRKEKPIQRAQSTVKLKESLVIPHRVWTLTADVRDPGMEAQMKLSFQRTRAQLEDKANRLADINESMRLELESAQAEGSSIVVLEKEKLTLRQDIDRFQKAFEHAEPRIEEVRKANAEKQASTAAKKEEHAAEHQFNLLNRKFQEEQETARADQVDQQALNGEPTGAGTGHDPGQCTESGKDREAGEREQGAGATGEMYTRQIKEDAGAKDIGQATR